MIILGIMIALLITVFLFGLHELLDAPLMEEDYEEEDYNDLYNIYLDEHDNTDDSKSND